ncbi:hypothetical protein MA5S0422_1142 [Mycobacteroides abscessus 5S-0422]|nr:hypothetical protein MA5S0421_0410 [Mycobacteroides abscessus 5S-0421]EIU18624.1 hypothetical protein MA5S0422_1142 [Mycobacteroides abscessus 5S-0422]EIU19898.1 hypothetical protein MA5S0708_2436 [Mycobacteroides abscessus 5S-0708]EIU34624.1 hypothetical protein MA5S0817_0186 [Mycobacteroides abscessus 5S-0817]EIU35248.1 hypothetical protein MA5S1212_0578 [Mycobacteroides abscessus 5S-1212]EIU42473.1 hypothetical protein MA5S1215_1915 [Mycobacteroides abscessus 5S-1215]EIU48573.1 hypothet
MPATLNVDPAGTNVGPGAAVDDGVALGIFTTVDLAGRVPDGPETVGPPCRIVGSAA